LKQSINSLFVIKYILISLFLIFTGICEAQESLVKIPKRAGLYSAVIPGAGQVYTKKYWKVPIIYSGLITSAYYFMENDDLYDLYKDTYLNRLNSNTADNLDYSNNDLITLTEFYRRNREVSALLFTLTYILNIVDASVSAHLFDYDVTEDISLHFQPIYMAKENANGLSLSIKL
jgi:hypothetical protein